MRTNKRLIFLVVTVVLIAFLQSCILNSKQEASLNKHVSKYTYALNDCKTMGVVGYTFPSYVRELLAKGDAVFIDSLKCNSNQFIYVPYQTSVKKNGDEIQAKYEFSMEFGDGISGKSCFYAISVDNGNNWYFLNKHVYESTEYCKDLTRLIR